MDRRINENIAWGAFGLRRAPIDARPTFTLTPPPVSGILEEPWKWYDTPVRYFSQETFGHTQAAEDFTGQARFRDDDRGYSYYSIEFSLLGEMCNTYLTSFNNFRNINLMSPIRRWFDQFDPRSISYDKRVNRNSVLAVNCIYPPFRFQPGLYMYRQYDYMIHNDFRTQESLTLEYLLECQRYNFSPQEIKDYSFLIGMDYDDIEYFLSFVAQEANMDHPTREFTTTFPLHNLMREMMRVRSLPLMLYDRGWCLQQPHLSFMKFLDHFMTVPVITKLRFLSRCERVTTKWILPDKNVICLSSDGALYEEPPGSFGTVPTYSDVPLELQSGAVSFYEKYKDLIESEVELNIQGMFDIEHKIDQKDISQIVTLVTEQFKGLVENFKNVTMDSINILIKIVTAIVIFLVFRRMVHNPNYANLFDLVVCVIFGTTIYAEYNPIKEIMKGIKRLQAGEVSDEISSKFCLLTLSQLFKVDCFSRKNLKDFVWFVSQAPRFAHGFDSICNYIKDMYEHCVNYFKKYVLKMEILTPESPVSGWIEELQKIVDQYSQGKLVLDEVIQTKLFELWKKGNNFLLCPVYRSDHHLISKYTNLIYQLMEKIPLSKRNGIEGSLRAPPATILLLGKSGVGKSTVTYPLSVEVAARIMLKEHKTIMENTDIINSIYARNSEQEYWDGYSGQLVTVYDDFMQRVDCSSSPNIELFEIIRASNIFPYPLHMAELKDKACTWFSSPVLIASSNMSTEKLQREIHSLNYPPALLRRFEMVVTVEAVGEKPVSGGDFDKTKYKFTRTIFKLDADDKIIKTTEPITYDEIVQFCVRRYYENKTTCQSVQEDMLRTIEKVRKDIFLEQNKDTIEIATAESNSVLTWTKNETKVNSETVKVQGKEEPKEEHQELIPQGPLMWIRDYFSGDDNSEFSSDTFFDAEEDLSDEPVEFPPVRLVVPDFEKDKQVVTSKWLKKYKSLCEEYPVIKYMKYIGMAIGALTVGFSIYSLFSREEKRVFEGGQQIVIPTVLESSEKIGSVKEISVESSKVKVTTKSKVTESSEKDGAISKVHVESQEKDGAISKVQVESQEKDSNYKQMTVESQERDGAVSKKTIENKFDLANIQVGEQQQLLSLQHCTNFVKQSLQGCSDQNAAEIISSVVCRNLYGLFIIREGYNDTRLGHIIFIKERIGMMPQHFLYFLKQAIDKDPNAILEFRSVFLRNNKFRFYIRDFLNEKLNKRYSPPECGNKLVDVCLIDIKGVNNHPNILSHFVTKSDIRCITRSDVVLPFIQVPNSSRYEPYAVMCYGTGVSELVASGPISSGDVNGKVYYSRQSWRYKLQSQPGSCGAPAVLIGVRNGPGRICGMHVMGDTDGNGFSATITQDDLVEWINELGPELKNSDEKQKALQAGVSCVLPFPGKFVPLGKPDVSIQSASTTKIRKSLLYEKISTVLKKPAWLCAGIYNGQPWDPREYRLSLFGSDRALVKQHIFDKMIDRYVHMVKCLEVKENKISPNFQSRYSFEVACTGIDGDPTFNSIKRKTSAGYPWCKEYKNGKADIFGKDDTFNFSLPGAIKVKERVTQVEENAAKGICDLHVFIDTLKDERKLIEKAHKTRLFSACPIDYLILCRMYFQGAVSRLIRTRISNGVAVGINVYSTEWSALALHLRKNEKFVAGDFAGFDSSEEREILRRAAQILIELSEDPRLDDETRQRHRRIRLVLMDALLESVHYSYDLLYSWSKGLPSGHFLTAIINSLFVILNMCYCFVVASGLDVDTAIKIFFEEFTIITYGDDHVLGVPERYIEIINQRTLPHLFQTVGMEYTMEDKDRAVDVDTRSIEQVSFIKRSFVYDKVLRRWLAPLELDSILDCMNWMKSGEDQAGNIEANVSFALKELALHPEEVWEKWFPRIKNACESVGVAMEYVNRDHAFMAALAIDDPIYTD